MTRQFEKWGDRGTFAWKNLRPIEDESEDGGLLVTMAVVAFSGLCIAAAVVWWVW